MTTMRRLAMMVATALVMMLGHTAGDEITQNPEVTAPAEDDAILLSDVSDTTNSAFGETSYIEIGTLLGTIGNFGFTGGAVEIDGSGVATISSALNSITANTTPGTDSVVTVTLAGAAAGDIAIFYTANALDTITFVNDTAGTANLDLGADVVLDSTNETLILRYNGSNWCQFSNSANIETVSETVSETFTILEPDQVQPISDEVLLKYFPAEKYPNGVTMVSWHVAASASISDVFNLLESASPTASTPSTMESITMSTATEGEDDGAFTDGDVAADGYVFLDFNATVPDNVAQLAVTLTYTINP